MQQRHLPFEEITVPRCPPLDYIFEDDGLKLYFENWDFDVKDQLPPNTLANGEKILPEDGEDGVDDEEDNEMATKHKSNLDTTKIPSKDQYELPMVIHSTGPTKSQRHCWLVVFTLFALLIVGIAFSVIIFTRSNEKRERRRFIHPTILLIVLPVIICVMMIKRSKSIQFNIARTMPPKASLVGLSKKNRFV